MKPSHIGTILDMALEAHLKGEIMNPLFTGDAGLGKSSIVQQWVKQQRERNPNFGFLDLRIAYYEAPDFRGYCQEVEINGKWRTITCLPSFWPTEGEGLLLLEEPNRGTTGVLNCLMQILTDRKVDDYTLPKGWIIAGCINPDSSEYDVTTMDAALKDRFEEYEIEYDFVTFSNFIEKAKWNPTLIHFINSGTWIYKSPKEIGKDGKYISPRTLAKMNAALTAGLESNRQLHYIVACSILGKEIGNEFHKFSFDQAPVTAKDILADKKAAFKRLKEHSDAQTYKGDMLSITIESIEKHYGGLKKDCKADQIDEDTMVEVAKIIPSDLAIILIKSTGYKQSNGQITTFFKEFTKRHPDVVDILKSNIQITRAVGEKSSK